MASPKTIRAIPKGLSEQQWRFALAYVKCFHATRAAKASGEYKSDKAASVSAARYLGMPQVKKAITGLLDEQNRIWAKEQWRVIQEALSLALANIDDFVKWGTEKLKPSDPGYDEEVGGYQDYDYVRFVPSKDLPRHLKAAVKSIKKTRNRDGSVSMELTLHQKSNNLEKLMKNLGLLHGKGEAKTNRGAFAAWSKDVKKQAAEAEKLEELTKKLESAQAELKELKGQSDEHGGETEASAGSEGGGGEAE